MGTESVLIQKDLAVSSMPESPILSTDITLTHSVPNHSSTPPRAAPPLSSNEDDVDDGEIYSHHSSLIRNMAGHASTLHTKNPNGTGTHGWHPCHPPPQWLYWTPWMAHPTYHHKSPRESTHPSPALSVAGPSQTPEDIPAEQDEPLDRDQDIEPTLHFSSSSPDDTIVPPIPMLIFSVTVPVLVM